MGQDTAGLRSQLRTDLRHRLRPMSGRDPDERGRSATPVELLYDLTYVIAFAAAADQLAHHISEGQVGAAIGAYVFAIFAVSWAWMNFTWFASAYGNDDALFRVATLTQMIGVVILTFGLPVSFASATDGGSPNNATMVAGYIVMRVPLIGLWLRAAREDPDHRRIDVAYAVTITIAQLGWVVSAVAGLPTGWTIALLVLLAVGELAAPAVLERRLGRPPWNAGHVTERFSLLTLITLGEVVAATTSAVAALTGEKGWSPASVVITASGLVLAAALWWAYFLIPARPILERWPERTMLWRYTHLPIFGAIAAIGAGLRVAATAVEEEKRSLLDIALALALPVAVVLTMIFVGWSVLMKAYDLTHVPLFALSMVPLVAAVALPALQGRTGPLDLGEGPDLDLLVAVVALVALSTIIEVVGHELVGFRHTVRAVDRATAPAE